MRKIALVALVFLLSGVSEDERASISEAAATLHNGLHPYILHALIKLVSLDVYVE